LTFMFAYRSWPSRTSPRFSNKASVSCRMRLTTRSPTPAGVPLSVGRLLVRARGLRARGELVAGHVLNQRGKDGFVHRRELYQACGQPLELAFRHGVEIHIRSGLGRAHPLEESLQRGDLKLRARANHARSPRQKACGPTDFIAGPDGIEIGVYRSYARYSVRSGGPRARSGRRAERPG
jgi:hypothetical protein